MLFSDMPYVRPDLEFLGAKIDEHVDELKSAKSFAEADAAFVDYLRVNERDYQKQSVHVYFQVIRA